MRLSSSERFIVHIDMNAYFASIEQQARREWRGRSVCVCAHLSRHACIIAPSREAKRVGIRVGMRVDEARCLDPQAVFVDCDPVKYRAVTKRIFGIFHEYTDCVEHYSIDEAFLDLSQSASSELSLIFLLCEIKRRIRDEVGEWLTASIGVGPNKLLAKLASEYQKPDGLTVVNINNLDDFLAEHALRDIAGIGIRTERRLQRLGIYTPLELKAASASVLLRTCGKPLYLMHEALHGLVVDQIRPYTPSAPQSIGHSYCLPRHLIEPDRVLGVFTKLIDRAVRRLCALHLTAEGVWVGLSLRNERGRQPLSVFDHYSATRNERVRFLEPSSDLFSITKAALKLFHASWSGTLPLSFIAVSLWGLRPKGSQTSLTGLEPQERRGERLTTAVQLIRSKYGDLAVHSAAQLSAENEAPERIGFRKVEDFQYAP